MLPEILYERARFRPDERAFTFLESGEHEGASLTWSQLEQRSRAIARAIRRRVPGRARVLLLFPPGLEFVPAFLGSLAAGTIAIAAFPPAGARDDRTTARLRRIVCDADVSVVLAPASLAVRRELLMTSIPELRRRPWLQTDAIPVDRDGPLEDSPRSSDLAFLQYTSGSTSQPRGVMVTHGNIIHNLTSSAALARYDGDSAVVSWLPVTHDMGLISGILQPVFSGFPAWLMAPQAFLQRPARWLQAISRVRATQSGAPDFAYALCARRVTADDKRELDLSSWQIAFNGSEPVRRTTLDAFHSAFHECGFRWTAFRPAYGLAESTLLVTSQPAGSEPRMIDVDASGLEAGVVTVVRTSNGTRQPISSGLSEGPAEIAIVDPVTLVRCAPDRVGEIWVRSGSVAAGYWNRPAETAAAFGARLAGTHEGPFLRTGDLGFVRDGHLFVTGRLKDLIIIRGRKHYPQELETTAESADPLVRQGCCVAFALDAGGEERVAFVAEVGARSERQHQPHRLTVAIDAIRRVVTEQHSIAPAYVAIVEPGALPRTTSGKLQRYLCREAVRTGTLRTLAGWSEPLEAIRAVS